MADGIETRYLSQMPSDDGVEWKGARIGKDGTDLDDKMEQMGMHLLFKEGAGSKKLGTLMGVFIPTLQNILGIILFLRLPWITGQAGILQGLAIVLLGCSASVLTSLSMSAIATNGVPKGGGAFSVIKESIGPEFGGTVGCLLFLSNTFGIAMYVLGCVEILQMWVTPLADVEVQILGAAVLAGLFTVVFVGISYISKASMVFMAGVVCAILSIYAGVVSHAVDPEPDKGIVGLSAANLRANWGPGYSGGNSFGVMLAIFFPAVTDPLAGSNLSGDLRSPQQSIPVGTVAAVVTTTFIFCSQVLFTGGSCDRATLQDDYIIVRNLAWPVPELIYVGMLMSTLGAGLQSLAGAPRLLAAIGKAGLVPEFALFAPASPDAEPRKAVAFCAALSCCAVMLGDLNAVAPFITMWFLTCYGIINGACAYLAYEKIPSFRPTFHYYDWRLSLLGAFQCFAMMFYCAPTWYYAVAACTVAVSIYFYIQRQLGLQASGHPQPGLCAKLCCARAVASTLEEGHTPPATTNTTTNTATARGGIGGGGGGSGSGEYESDGGEGGGGGGQGGDWRSGRRFVAAREALLALKPGDMDFKYWRPFVLFLAKVDKVDGRYVPQGGMIHLCQQLMKRGKGLSVVGGVVAGAFEDQHAFLDAALAHLHAAMQERKIEGFPEVICAPSVYAGYKTLVTAKGLGSLRPNTVMLGWPSDVDAMGAEEEAEYASLCAYVALAKKTLLLCKFQGGAQQLFPAASAAVVGSEAGSGLAGEAMRGFIDVWWIFDLFPSNGLMLLLPYLLQQHKVWKKCSTRLFVVAAAGSDLGKVEALLQVMLKAGGLVVHVQVLAMPLSEAPAFHADTHLSDFPATTTTTTTGGGGDGPGQENPMVKLHLVLDQHHKNQRAERGSGRSPAAEEAAEEAAAAAAAATAAQGASAKEGESAGSKGGMAAVLARYSAESPLVVLTLPKQRAGQAPGAWLRSTQELVAPLQRCIFVQESGHERIQFMRE